MLTKQQSLNNQKMSGLNTNTNNKMPKTTTKVVHTTSI